MMKRPAYTASICLASCWCAIRTVTTRSWWTALTDRPFFRRYKMARINIWLVRIEQLWSSAGMATREQCARGQLCFKWRQIRSWTARTPGRTANYTIRRFVAVRWFGVCMGTLEITIWSSIMTSLRPRLVALSLKIRKPIITWIRALKLYRRPIGIQLVGICVSVRPLSFGTVINCVTLMCSNKYLHCSWKAQSIEPESTEYSTNWTNCRYEWRFVYWTVQWIGYNKNYPTIRKPLRFDMSVLYNWFLFTEFPQLSTK